MVKADEKNDALYQILFSSLLYHPNEDQMQFWTLKDADCIRRLEMKTKSLNAYILYSLV